MQDNVINFEEVLEERDEDLEKALKEVSFYKKKYFCCLKEKEEIEDMNKKMAEFIESIAEE